ncbi:hypothetical protein QBC35DRAFT_489647 [Podospora australis]|uniref:Uncharacterized protein n=1 Tax=Podospora australis TaxID=1536484 RepID=A0AAN6X063_9PEZI|nr:hypothetical protein QBC35DRAFT_489647 [Podospora australis]
MSFYVLVSFYLCFVVMLMLNDHTMGKFEFYFSRTTRSLPLAVSFCLLLRAFSSHTIHFSLRDQWELDKVWSFAIQLFILHYWG